MLKRVTGRYDYRDVTGRLVYWKERVEPGRNGSKKEFIFYHANRIMGRGGDSVLYHLPDVIRSKAVIINEGEKQADVLKKWGLCATSLDSGAASRLNPGIIDALTGKRLAILQDNDQVGTDYALKLAKGLQGKFESLRIVLLPRLPDKGDICDWDGDKQELLKIIKATPEWILPPAEPKKEKRSTTREHKDGDIDNSMIDEARQYPIEKLIEFQNGKALCISHKEKTPSMTIFKNKACCHGCGKSFSTIDVVMMQESMDFVTAVKYLAGGA